MMYFYRVAIKDTFGSASVKEGDITSNKLLVAVRQVENLNRNKWNADLMNIALFEMDVESGQIDFENPAYVWSKAAGVLYGALNYAPLDSCQLIYDPDTNTFKEDREDNKVDWGKWDFTKRRDDFNASKLGHVRHPQKATYPSIIFKKGALK